MNGAGLFFLLLLLLVILPACAWIGWTRWRAHSQGLPPPPLAAYNPFNREARRGSATYISGPGPSGPLAWVQDKFQTLRSKATGGGSGDHGGGAGGRRGFGPLDPEDRAAWDDRVGGPVGDYEEQELGLRPPPYDAAEEGRGRSRSRDGGIGGGTTAYTGARGLSGGGGGGRGGYDDDFEDVGTGDGERANPFGDHVAERSELRETSPRPVMDDGRSSRRSHFTEDM